MNNFERIQTARDAIDYVRNGLPQKFGADKIQLALAGDVLDIFDGTLAILRKVDDKFELVTEEKTVIGRIEILNAVEDIMYGEVKKECDDNV